MELLKDRIHILRKTLNISMEKFGNCLGISKSSISGFEKGITNPSEQTLKLICREFNVDYFWLTEGADVDMFRKLPNTLLEKLSEQYNLNIKSQVVLKTYLEVPKEEKEVIENFLLSLAENLQKEDKED